MKSNFITMNEWMEKKKKTNEALAKFNKQLKQKYYCLWETNSIENVNYRTMKHWEKIILYSKTIKHWGGKKKIEKSISHTQGLQA